MSTSKAPAIDRNKRRNTATALIAGSIVVGMVGMAFAAVPLYDLFCKVTGYGGTTQRADIVSDEVLDRVVTIRFDSNADEALGWDFRPAQREVEVRIGEAAEVMYVAANLGDEAVTGTASFNVAPSLVGAYFMKVECFCFTEQTLAGGESVEMPVLFFIDPSIADDPNLDYVDTITLSYTFFRTSGAQPEGPVAQTAVGGDG